MIAAIYVEQERHDTRRVVHYAGGDMKKAIQKARDLSQSCVKDCAWLVVGSKAIAKYFKGQRFKPSDTV